MSTKTKADGALIEQRLDSSFKVSNSGHIIRRKNKNKKERKEKE